MAQRLTCHAVARSAKEDAVGAYGIVSPELQAEALVWQRE